PVARSPDRTDPDPVLRGQVVAVHFYLAVVVDAARVADDVQISVAINITKAQPVIDRGGGFIFDTPDRIHVSEMSIGRAAQEPKEIPSVPQNISEAVVIKIGHHCQAPGDIVWFAGCAHASKCARLLVE